LTGYITAAEKYNKLVRHMYAHIDLWLRLKPLLSFALSDQQFFYNI